MPDLPREVEVDPLAGLPAGAGEQLRKASVLIAGLGNIGSPLASLLAGAGVRLLRLVDRDRVEAKNLATQDYSAADVGRFKAEALAERLRRRFPRLGVESRTTDLEDLPLGAGQVDVVLGALDSRRARQVLVSEIAWPLGVPVVDGGVGEGLRGRVQVFLPRPETACLECTWGDADYRQLAVEYPCVPGASATAPPTVAPAFAGTVVAGIMTAECVRLLAGQAPAESREIALDLFHQRFLVSRLRRAPKCRFRHEVVGEFLALEKELSSATVGDLLALVEHRFADSAIHLEFRRNLLGEGFDGGRFLPLERLRPRAAEPLAALGLVPADRIRVRGQTHSAFITLDGSRLNGPPPRRVGYRPSESESHTPDPV